MNLRMITIIRQRMFQRGLFSINQAVRGRRVRCADQFRSIRVRDRPLCELPARREVESHAPAENTWKRRSETPTSRPGASKTKPELEP